MDDPAVADPRNREPDPSTREFRQQALGPEL